MWKQIQWLWENMDAPFRRRHVIALSICAFTCLMLLVNPALSQRLIDDVIVAQNPEPLLPITATTSPLSTLKSTFFNTSMLP